MIFGNTPPKPEPPPIALTIAGSDSGGGAGMQADLKTFAACGVHGTCVATLITAQNTVGVQDVYVLPQTIVRSQFSSVTADLWPAAAKTGALGSTEMVHTVVEMLRERPITNLVVDPVMVSKHGDPLLPEATVKAVREFLLPLAILVTPNRFEATALSRREVEGPSSMKDAAKAIYDLGVPNVLIKGSHLERIARDYFYDGSGFIEFGADRVDTKHTHGSGCTHSAAITARLAHGDELVDAVAWAREFISDAIAKTHELGAGVSPVNSMNRLWS